VPLLENINKNFNGNAQVEVEGKNVKQVLTLARLDVKKRNEGWKQILETDFEKEKLELMRKLKAYD